MTTTNNDSGLNPDHLEALAPCPFCGATARIESNRDRHKLVADHDDDCVLADGEHVVSYPAHEGYRVRLICEWNRRAAPVSAPIAGDAPNLRIVKTRLQQILEPHSETLGAKWLAADALFWLTKDDAYAQKADALANQPAPLDQRFVADLERSRAKYPGIARMFDGLMGEVGELARAYHGDGDRAAEAFDVAVVAYRIATEGDDGGNTRLDAARLGDIIDRKTAEVKAIIGDPWGYQPAPTAAPEQVAQVHLDNENWMDVPLREVPVWVRKGFKTRTLSQPSEAAPLAWMKPGEIDGLLAAAEKPGETRHYGRVYARQYDADMIPVRAAPSLPAAAPAPTVPAFHGVEHLIRYSQWSNGAACGMDPSPDGRWVEYDDLIAHQPAQEQASIPELSKAFMTLESSGGEGRTIVLKFNQRADAYAVHDYLMKAGSRDYRGGDSQAAQHEAAPLSDTQLDRIARSYFSEQWAVAHAKDAIHDAFMEAAKVAASPVVRAQSEESRPRRELPPGAKEAIAAAHATGSTVAALPDGSPIFINYGHDYGDTAHLECTACGGSGHREDQQAHAGADEKDAERFVVFVDSVLQMERGFEHLSDLSAAVCEEMMERKPRTLDKVREAVDAAIRAAQEGGAA